MNQEPENDRLIGMVVRFVCGAIFGAFVGASFGRGYLYGREHGWSWVERRWRAEFWRRCCVMISGLGWEGGGEAKGRMNDEEKRLKCSRLRRCGLVIDDQFCLIHCIRFLCHS